MEVDQLKALVCVAQTGSFTSAARLLYVTQPAVSRRIDQLEHAVGVLLVDRSTRRVGLTPAGALLAVRAESILIALREAERDCHAATADLPTQRTAAPGRPQDASCA